MNKIEIIKNFLDKNTDIYSRVAGTGTLYIDYKGHKIRVSDHEESVTRLRESAEKCFYTKTADNKAFGVCDIIGDVLDYLEGNFDFDFTRELKIKLFEL